MIIRVASLSSLLIRSKVEPMRILFAVLALLLLPQAARADLKPAEIAVVAMRDSRQSVELAEYYVDARGIPADQICLINCTPGETVSREEWESKVRPQILGWILDNQLETKLRCLVTVWDVPLRIGKADPQSTELVQRVAYLKGERENRIFRVRTLMAAVNEILPAAEEPAELPPETDDLKTIIKDLEAAFGTVRERLQPVANTPEGRQATARLTNIFAASGGLVNVMRNLQTQVQQQPDNEALKNSLATTAGQITGLREGRAAIERLPDGIDADEAMLSVVEKSDGLLGSLAWIDGQLMLLEKNETYSSFDSELSLLYWPTYSLGRWQSNVLHYQYDNSYTRQLRATLMVSRIEAPTFELSKKLIDTAIAVEKKGLEGKFYLDSRGKGKLGETGPRGSTKDFDSQLVNLAAFLRKETDVTVVLDEVDDVFQPGDCPLAALYCGWYSLANYIDAFEWQPGAVGYHLASSEASTLRKPTSKVWCKRMLEDGVCATIGPVEEPYLNAFPRPNEFFILLLSGKHTLVECYYRSKPYNSWVMVLVGDPLYNPYKADPKFAGKPMPPALEQLINGPPAMPVP